MITKQQLGNTLWGMAEILYDKVEDYKTYILSLLFFKRLSDNWTWEIDNKVREHVATYGKEPNAKQLAAITAEAHDFVIPEGCFWGDVKNASSTQKNEKLDAAVKALAEANPPLKGIINAGQKASGQSRPRRDRGSDLARISAHRADGCAEHQLSLRWLEPGRSDSQPQRHECRFPRRTLAALIFLRARPAADGAASVAGQSGECRRRTTGVAETRQIERCCPARRISARDGIVELTITRRQTKL